MKVIDLFSGLGGFSEGFIAKGHDVVRYDNDKEFETIPNTIIKDVSELGSTDLKGADVIVASPPCQCFSCAALGYYWKGGSPSPKTKEAIKLVKFTVDLIQQVNPTYWVLENPRGMMRHVLGKPAITTFWAAWGMPYYKPTDLWGKLPNIIWPKPKMWQPAPRGGLTLGISRSKRFYSPEDKTTWAIGHLPTRKTEMVKVGGRIYNIPETWDSDTFKRNVFAYLAPKGAALRALIPFKFSEALAIACEKGIGHQLTIFED